MIARHVPEKAEKLNRFFSIPSTERLRSLLAGADFSEVEVRAETRSIGFASFNAYFSGIEKGATLSGQEFVLLPPPLQSRVRDEVRHELKLKDDTQPFAIDMEVLIGSGSKAAR